MVEEQLAGITAEELRQLLREKVLAGGTIIPTMDVSTTLAGRITWLMLIWQQHNRWHGRPPNGSASALNLAVRLAGVLPAMIADAREGIRVMAGVAESQPPAVIQQDVIVLENLQNALNTAITQQVFFHYAFSVPASDDWHRYVHDLARWLQEAVSSANPNAAPLGFSDRGPMRRFLEAMVPRISRQAVKGPTIMAWLRDNPPPKLPVFDADDSTGM